MKLKTILSALFIGMLAFGCSDDNDDGITILSVTPTNGSNGLVVTITGENFGTETEGLTVRFGPAAATVTSLSDTEIVTTVPNAAPIGATTIQVVRGDDSESVDFTVNDPIVGNWITAGENVAPLLAAAPFNVLQIIADFRPDGTYTVISTDTDNSETTFTGTWQTAEGAGDIREITINQSAPTILTSVGIYRNSNGVLTYEIVQTNPPITGVTPPTAAGGFGSTSGGQLAQANVQTYVRNN
ncbi:MAG: IPT/TIG domain-containing protein [Bacteroidota bacterium]